MASSIQLSSTNNSEMKIEYQGTSGVPKTVVPDKTCSTRQFYLCLKDKIGKFHATYIAFGGSIGCWVKYTKKMVQYTLEKYKW